MIDPFKTLAGHFLLDTALTGGAGHRAVTDDPGPGRDRLSRLGNRTTGEANKTKKPIVKKLVLRNARRVLIIDALFLIADGYEVLWGNNRQSVGTVSQCKYLKQYI